MHLFLNERLIDVEVSLEHYEGLKVSNSAIVEKVFKVKTMFNSKQ